MESVQLRRALQALVYKKGLMLYLPYGDMGQGVKDAN